MKSHHVSGQSSLASAILSNRYMGIVQRNPGGKDGVTAYGALSQSFTLSAMSFMVTVDILSAARRKSFKWGRT